MKTQFFCLLMFFSVTALAEPTTSHNEEWEGASMEIKNETSLKHQNNGDNSNEIDLRNPWNYGRQDSDSGVNRDRNHVHYD